ncbi:hypothetical protein BaRGS_00021721 [Batillaria attramentaria]|uniref:Uncharacterized protein n=1 Tax=Batillaria attramentaria TaxID=370345 RepID=A0ABD0KIZ0_9CAEN|nr:hypothetical protein BaRGS_022131 [Batillaria attramentaria]
MQRLPAHQHEDLFYIPATLRAPLATFDTVDLGDEDILSLKSLSQNSLCNKAAYEEPTGRESHTVSAKIGGAQSKGKDLAGKSGSGQHCQHPASHGEHLKEGAPCQDPSQEEGKGRDDSDGEDDAPTPTNQSPAHSPVPQREAAEAVGSVPPDASASSSKRGQELSAGATGVQRIGKVAATWLPHQDSDSSSSSSGSGNDVFTFRPIHGSTFAAASRDEDDDDDDDDRVDLTPSTRRRLVREKSKDYHLNLYPEDLDPSQITSPSKRKAFQKRLQRLQVKTSPITRPRSTTPISVHTLDEYATSSPDRSPASPFQDKLKITLPREEFSPRPKSPRKERIKTQVQDDAHFVFSEELLFSHTRSALVVDEVGQVPISPRSRRVLIPPTLSPSSSPKVGRAEGRFAVENAPQLVYFENEKEEKIFGEPAAGETSEDWASFPEASNQPCADDTPTVRTDKPNPLNPFLCDEAEADEILTVNIQSLGASKPANIQVVLSAASSSTPSPSSPESSGEAPLDSASKTGEVPGSGNEDAAHKMAPAEVPESHSELYQNSEHKTVLPEALDGRGDEGHISQEPVAGLPAGDGSTPGEPFPGIFDTTVSAGCQ